MSAEATYQLAYPTVGFADTWPELGPGGVGSTCSGLTQVAACLMDSLLFQRRLQSTLPKADTSSAWRV